MIMRTRSFVLKETMVKTESVQSLENIITALESCADDFYNGTVDKTVLAKKLSQYGVFKKATIDGEIAGFIGYYANDLESGMAYLSTIVISKNYQGRGIGTLLLRECLDDCRNRGMITCRLEVDKNNTSAITFYKRFGFVKEKEASEMSDNYICRL